MPQASEPLHCAGGERSRTAAVQLYSNVLAQRHRGDVVLNRYGGQRQAAVLPFTSVTVRVTVFCPHIPKTERLLAEHYRLYAAGVARAVVHCAGGERSRTAGVQLYRHILAKSTGAMLSTIVMGLKQNQSYPLRHRQ